VVKENPRGRTTDIGEEKSFRMVESRGMPCPHPPAPVQV